MSKKWEYTPDKLRALSIEAQLSIQKKKDIMAQLRFGALEGDTYTLLCFETSGECRLAKKYLESLGYEVRFHYPFTEKLVVKWGETK